MTKIAGCDSLIGSAIAQVLAEFPRQGVDRAVDAWLWVEGNVNYFSEW